MVNATIAARGAPHDYDRWATLAGAGIACSRTLSPSRPTTTLAISPFTALASHPKATIDQYVNPTVFVGGGDLLSDLSDSSNLMRNKFFQAMVREEMEVAQRDIRALFRDEPATIATNWLLLGLCRSAKLTIAPSADPFSQMRAPSIESDIRYSTGA
jgi:hypothetical protein